MADPKAPITCHILDTSRGVPAANVRVRLELTPPPPSFSPSTTTTTTAPPSSSSPPPAASIPIVFESTTNADGRVTAWQPSPTPRAPAGAGPVHNNTLEGVLGTMAAGAASRWTLRFDSAGYFAGLAPAPPDTLFPEVVVVVEVRAGQRYHVPLLLAPFGYSTYRGS